MFTGETLEASVVRTLPKVAQPEAAEIKFKSRLHPQSLTLVTPTLLGQMPDKGLGIRNEKQVEREWLSFGEGGVGGRSLRGALRAPS